jgi:hypothetical protein
MAAVLEQPICTDPAVLKGIELGEMNARFEGIDLTEDPLWRDMIKPQLLSGAIDFAGAQEIFHKHYAERRNA